jgi:hypothetical protein
MGAPRAGAPAEPGPRLRFAARLPRRAGMEGPQGRILELLSRGCATAGALAQMLGVSDSRAEALLMRMERGGLVARHYLFSVIAWCPAGSERLQSVLVPCGSDVVAIDVRGLAETVAVLVEMGARTLRPVRLARLLGLRCAGAALRAVAGVLRLMLDGALVERRRGRRLLLIVTDPRAAVERLRRIAETGILQLDPVPYERE